MKNKNFQELLIEEVKKIKENFVMLDGNWAVKGFVDIYKNVYPISQDTKIISKIIEILFFPVLQKFAINNGYK